jgi:hypothetical protein
MMMSNQSTNPMTFSFRNPLDSTTDATSFNAEVSQTFRDILPMIVRGGGDGGIEKCFPAMLWTALSMFDGSLSPRTAEFHQRLLQEPGFAEKVGALRNPDDWTKSNWAGVFPLSMH